MGERNGDGSVADWSNGMMDLKPSTPILQYSITPWVVVLMLLGLSGGCDSMPGKPTPEERWTAAAEVTDFSQLYAANCAGCHGVNGRFGAARPLNDSIYLALVS